MRRQVIVCALVVAAAIMPAGAGAGGKVGFAGAGKAGSVGARGPAGFFFVRRSATPTDVAVFSGLAMGFHAAGNTYGGIWRDDPTYLIVDATPPDAQVFLNGRRLGSAGELIARALPISLGQHAVQVEAPGYRTRVLHFVADGSFPVRIRTTLTAD